jgi:hypothetical protein
MACGGVLIMIKWMLMLEMKDLFRLGVENLFQKRGKKEGKDQYHDGTRRVVRETRLDTLTPEQSNWTEVYSSTPAKCDIAAPPPSAAFHNLTSRQWESR